MPRYQAPLRDMKFLLNEVLEIGSYSNLPRFADAPADVIDAVLDGGAKFAEEVLQPINAIGDRQGCKRNADASVKTPDGFPKQIWVVDEEHGNQVFEAIYGGSQTGRYHGYPIRLRDPFFDHVLTAWKARRDAA